MPDLDEIIQRLRQVSGDQPRRDWYAFSAKAGSRKALLRIYDEIAWYGTSARSFADELDDLDVDEIDLRLNSPGGHAWDGLAIFNALRAHPAKITVTVDGMAASAASAIAMAGDRIVMNRGSVMMIHDASGFAMGNAKVMTKTADWLDKLSDSYADVYAARAGGTPDEWRAVMVEETWYKAQEAVDAGLADELIDDSPEPSSSAKASFDLSRFAYAYAGRDAAPPPKIPHPKTSAPEQTPGASSCPPLQAAEAIRRVHAASQTTHASPAWGDQKGATQVDLAKLREALGLAQDVSDDEVKASALAALNPPAAPPATPPEAPPTAPIPATVPGTVVLSQSVWDETQKQLKSLAGFVDQTKRDQRDTFLAKAISEGKFTPSQKAQFAKLWDSNPDGTRALIESMTPNSAFATEAMGYAGGDGDTFENEYKQMVAALGGRS